jgi:hypothetical protein
MASSNYILPSVIEANAPLKDSVNYPMEYMAAGKSCSDERMIENKLLNDFQDAEIDDTAEESTNIEQAERGLVAERTKRTSVLAHTGPLLGLVIATTMVFVFTAWYAQATFSNNLTSSAQKAMYAVFRVEVGSALAVLRLMQGLLTTLTSAAIFKAFELIKWALLTNANAMDCLRLLSISPETSILGSVGIIVDRRTRHMDRIWSLMR